MKADVKGVRSLATSKENLKYGVFLAGIFAFFGICDEEFADSELSGCFCPICHRDVRQVSGLDNYIGKESCRKSLGKLLIRFYSISIPFTHLFCG